MFCYLSGSSKEVLAVAVAGVVFVCGCFFVLFLLPEEAEAFLAVFILAILVAHSDPAGVPRTGRDGRHGHCPTQAAVRPGRVFGGGRLHGRVDGPDP